MAADTATMSAEDRNLPALLRLLPEEFKPQLDPSSLRSLTCTSRAVQRLTGHKLVDGLVVDLARQGAAACHSCSRQQ